MGPILWKSFFRSLFHHPWQLVFSLIGVALGVGLVVSIDLANDSAKLSFKLSTESAVGRTTHHITGSDGTVSADLYRQLRIEKGIRLSAPIVEGYASAVDFPGYSFRILGIDLVVDRPFRAHLTGMENLPLLDLTALISDPGTIILSEDMASSLGLAVGNSLLLRVGSITHKTEIVGLIKPQDRLTRLALENFCITDIATAQEIFHTNDRLHRIDLIIANDKEGRAQLQAIEKFLPQGTEIIRSSTRAEHIETMMRAFQLNLTALSLFALIVGMFIIYNAITFSVVRRRQLIGTLRCLGVTRSQIFTLILTESMVIGIIGTLLGLFIGILLGKNLVHLVSRAINDLYFVLSVNSLEISFYSLLKGMGLGLCATLIASLGPALEATAASPRTIVTRSTIESRVQKMSPKLALSGIGMFVLGVVLLFVSGKNILLSYFGLFIIMLGCVLVTPRLITLIMGALQPIALRVSGILGSYAARSISTNLSRTSIAIAALMIALASTIGVGVMIGSFRTSVIHWLDILLQADFYVSAPRLVATRGSASLDEELVKRIRAIEGISHVGSYQWFDIVGQQGRTPIGVMEVVAPSRKNYLFKQGNPETIWDAFQQGKGVLLSEPYAFRHNLNVGSNISLRTESGMKNFPVLGVFVSYNSDQGVVMISRALYKKFWNDKGVSALWLYAEEGVNSDAIEQKVRNLIPPSQTVEIRSNKLLRQETLQIFDRTFAITAVMRLLAMIVAFIGVITALMALQLERQREFGILRATGFTPYQVSGLILVQTGLMGVVAGLLAIPVGLVTALVMVFVINRRSFGWTLQLDASPEIFLHALLLAILAAILAGVVPAIKIAISPVSAALRDE